MVGVGDGVGGKRRKEGRMDGWMEGRGRQQERGRERLEGRGRREGKRENVGKD